MRAMPNPPPPRRTGHALLLACFFATGLTGLVYEVVWARMLELYFGATQFAITTVLTTFMAGLALGSAAGGRLVDRLRRPLWLYGAVEIAVGLYCLATPTVFDAIGRVHLAWLTPEDLVSASFQAERFALAAVALALPTTLMGTTLPILATHLVRRPDEVGGRVGLLYGLNTLGAVGGCLLAGFAALPWLGISRTLVATGVLDIALGAAVLTLARGTRATPVERGPGRSGPPRAGRAPARGAVADAAEATSRGLALALPAALAISGFTALAYEVLWFRVLALVIGSSIYAFTVMLATFLAGIAGGSALVARGLPRARSPLRWLAVLELGVAFSVLVGVALYGRLPGLFLALFGALSEHFWLFLAVQSAVCASIMLVPTLCLGAVLPTAAQVHARRLDALGRRVGDVYSSNTLGAIVGSIAAGFVLQPLLGIQRSIGVVAAVNLVLGLAFWIWPQPAARAPRAAARARRAAPRGRRSAPIRSPGIGLVPRVAGAVGLVAAFAGLAAVLPSWDPRRMTVGPYVNQQAVGDYLRGYDQGRALDELLYYREGVNAVISVRRARDGSWLSYQANGKWEGTVGESAPNWSLLGHIPLLLAPEPKRALLVGLGTGVTLGALTQHPLERIDVVEIEPAVIEAAGFFAQAHGDALHDPRVHVYRSDGRTFLAVGDARYDVIVSGVSDPWISGVSNLFTREYFERLSGRLAEDGVAAIWFQNYRISSDDLKTALHTLATVFPDVSVWAPRDDPADLILVARRRPLRIDAETLHRRLQTQVDRASLERSGVANIFDFLNLLILEDGDVRAYVRDAPLHTDDRPILEFSLPRLLYTDVHEGVLERTWDLVRHTRDFDPPVVVPEAIRASFYTLLASTYSHYEYRQQHAIALFERVLEMDPDNARARRYLASKGRLPPGDVAAPGPPPERP